MLNRDLVAKPTCNRDVAFRDVMAIADNAGSRTIHHMHSHIAFNDMYQIPAA